VLVTHDEEQQCQITDDGLAVDNDGDDLSYLSDHATTPGADNAIENLGSIAICEVDYVTGPIDDIIPPDASNVRYETKSISMNMHAYGKDKKNMFICISNTHLLLLFLFYEARPSKGLCH
jgi:hypothetical protein